MMASEPLFKTWVPEWLIRIMIFLIFLPNVFLFGVSTANINAACGYYGIDPNGIQYSLIILYVTFVSYYPLEKRFSGFFQTRDYLILSVLLEVFTVMISLWVSNFAMLIFIRFLQGLTACNVGSVCIALIFSRLRSDRALKIGYSVIYGVLLSIFPLITFLTAPLIDTYNYNSIYSLAGYLFIPGVILLAKIMNAGNLKPRVMMEDVDWPSALFLFLCLSATGFALVYGQQLNWLQDIKIWLSLLITIAGSALFIIRQRGLKTPYIDFRIFRYRNYVTGLLLIQFLYLARGTFNLTATYFSGVLGMDQRHSGRLLLFNILGVVMGSLVSSRMIQRRSYRFTWIIGFGSLLCYYLWMERLISPHTDPYTFILPLLLFGFGSGMVLASVVTFMVISIPLEMGLSGITIAILARLAGTSLSIALVNYCQVYSRAIHLNLIRDQWSAAYVLLNKGFEKLQGIKLAEQIELRSLIDYYDFISGVLVLVIIAIAVTPLVINTKNQIDPVDNLPI